MPEAASANSAQIGIGS